MSFKSVIARRKRRSKKLVILPTTAIWILAALGFSLVILTASIGGLMLMVKHRFDSLSSTIEKITSQEEINSDFEQYEILARQINSSINSTSARLQQEVTAISQDILFVRRIKDSFLPLSTRVVSIENSINSWQNYNRNDAQLSSDCATIQTQNEEMQRQFIRNYQIFSNIVARPINPLTDTEFLGRIIPLGYVYLQLRNTLEPSQLWSLLRWTELEFGSNVTSPHYFAVNSANNISRYMDYRSPFPDDQFYSSFRVDLVKANPRTNYRTNFFFLQPNNSSPRNFGFSLAPNPLPRFFGPPGAKFRLWIRSG